MQRASSESPVRGRRALFFDEFTTVAARWVFAMVIASLTFRTQPHKRAEVLSAMDALLERLRNVPGCVRGRLLADVEDSSAFTLASEWSNGEAVASFFESHAARALTESQNSDGALPTAAQDRSMLRGRGSGHRRTPGGDP